MYLSAFPPSQYRLLILVTVARFYCNEGRSFGTRVWSQRAFDRLPQNFIKLALGNPVLPGQVKFNC